MKMVMNGAALAVSALLLGACGDNGDETPAKSGTARLAPAALVDRDPHAIACGHVRDQQTWAAVTRRATVALADREQFRDLNRLRATQSLFFAMTELCKGRPASYRPATAAVRGVKDGRFVTDLSTP